MTHRPSAVTLNALLVLALAIAGCSDASQDGPTETATPPESAATEAPPSEAPPSEAPPSEAPPSEAPATPAPAAAEAEVRITEPDFIPEMLTIAVGTEVTWVNDDTYSHTVTEGTDGDVVADPIIDEPIAAGGTVSVIFDEPGTYDITCRIHPTMQMTLVVEG
jgi:plastocyanin